MGKDFNRGNRGDRGGFSRGGRGSFGGNNRRRGREPSGVVVGLIKRNW